MKMMTRRKEKRGRSRRRSMHVVLPHKRFYEAPQTGRYLPCFIFAWPRPYRLPPLGPARHCLLLHRPRARAHRAQRRISLLPVAHDHMKNASTHERMKSNAKDATARENKQNVETLRYCRRRADEDAWESKTDKQLLHDRMNGTAVLA